MVLRSWMLALVALGLAGTLAELVLLEHYEEPAQIAPVALLGLSLAGVAVHAAVGTAATVRLIRALMLVLIVTGAIGVVLHFRGNMEFQLEMDATQSGWPLVRKILHAKTPPALAPGVMAQLGLLGLLSTYRHPAVSGQATSPGR